VKQALSTTLDADLFRRGREAAAQRGVSFSALIERALDRYLGEKQDEAPAGVDARIAQNSCPKGREGNAAERNPSDLRRGSQEVRYGTESS